MKKYYLLTDTEVVDFTNMSFIYENYLTITPRYSITIKYISITKDNHYFLKLTERPFADSVFEVCNINTKYLKLDKIDYNAYLSYNNIHHNIFTIDKPSFYDRSDFLEELAYNQWDNWGILPIAVTNIRENSSSPYRKEFTLYRGFNENPNKAELGILEILSDVKYSEKIQEFLHTEITNNLEFNLHNLAERPFSTWKNKKY